MWVVHEWSACCVLISAIGLLGNVCTSRHCRSNRCIVVIWNQPGRHRILLITFISEERVIYKTGKITETRFRLCLHHVKWKCLQKYCIPWSTSFSCYIKLLYRGFNFLPIFLNWIFFIHKHCKSPSQKFHVYSNTKEPKTRWILKRIMQLENVNVVWSLVRCFSKLLCNKF